MEGRMEGGREEEKNEGTSKTLPVFYFLTSIVVTWYLSYFYYFKRVCIYFTLLFILYFSQYKLKYFKVHMKCVWKIAISILILKHQMPILWRHRT